MKNILLSLGIVAVLGANGLVANEVVDTKTPNLQKQELEFLFGENANASDLNVAVLSEKELKETQGEAIFAGAVAAATLIYNIGQDHGWWKFRF